MKILINDANILIDLVKLDLVEQFVNLTFDLYTSDFVLEELIQDQKIIIQHKIDEKKIGLIVTESEVDFAGINKLLQLSSGLSFEDCSIWYYSKTMKGTLITGDGKLRKLAKADGVDVRGILFILDELLGQNLISPTIAINKIQSLYQLNNRLPKKELENRIKVWGNMLN